MKKIILIIVAIILLSLFVFVFNTVNVGESNEKMELKSSVFENNGKIPSKYTCDSENVNPPLIISEVPDNAKSLVLIMDDPDIPNFVKEQRGIDVFVHWVVFNIPSKTTLIEEGKEPEGILGNNSGGSLGYTGPCPPDAEHRYFFKLYALDTELDLPKGSGKKEVEAAMQGHIIEQTELVGKYERT